MKALAVSLIFLSTFLVFASPGAAFASTKVEIARMRDDTRDLPTTHGPIFVTFYKFEVNPEKTKTRVVVDYDVAWANDADHIGPQPTYTMLPNLTFDALSGNIIYDDGGRKVVCATARETNGFFGKHLKIKKTGLCKVTSQYATHTESDGWKSRSYSSLDVFLEVL